MPPSACRKRSKTCGRNSGGCRCPCRSPRSPRPSSRARAAPGPGRPLGVNFTAFEQQVPDDLLQPLGIARNRAGIRIEHGLEPDALRVGRGPHRLDRVLDDAAAASTGCTSSRSLPEMMRETSSTSSTIWVSDVRVARHGLERPASLLAGQQAGLQHPRLADDRVQRRPQLVRQRGQELVLQPAGGPGNSSRRCRSSSARCRSLMSRAIFEAPTTVPCSSRIGETLKETATRPPSFRSRTVS